MMKKRQTEWKTSFLSNVTAQLLPLTSHTAGEATLMQAKWIKFDLCLYTAYLLAANIVVHVIQASSQNTVSGARYGALSQSLPDPP